MEEQLLKTCDSVTLTTYCVRKSILWGKDQERVTELLSIPLEQVTHCRIVSCNYPILIGLAFVVGFLGIIPQEPKVFLIGLMVAALLICIYLASRHSETEIASPTAKIKFRIDGANSKDAIDFINCLERELASRKKYKAIEMTVAQPPTINSQVDYWGA